MDYSIIVPAYNEEQYLADTLQAILQSMKEISLQGELIVTDNNSSDNTGKIAENMGAKVVFEAVNQISRARNAGASIAQGRYLIFIDADTIASTALLQQALNNLESGQCIGGGATVATRDEVALLVRAVLGYWNLISRGLRLAAGCFVYARKDAFQTVGGFSEKVFASEEIWLSIALKRQARKEAKKFCIINHPRVNTSGRKLNWYSYSYQLLLLLMLFFFPFMTRYKWACNYWYRRPPEK